MAVAVVVVVPAGASVQLAARNVPQSLGEFRPHLRTAALCCSRFACVGLAFELGVSMLTRRVSRVDGRASSRRPPVALIRFASAATAAVRTQVLPHAANLHASPFRTTNPFLSGQI